MNLNEAISILNTHGYLCEKLDDMFKLEIDKIIDIANSAKDRNEADKYGTKFQNMPNTYKNCLKAYLDGCSYNYFDISFDDFKKLNFKNRLFLNIQPQAYPEDLSGEEEDDWPDILKCNYSTNNRQAQWINSMTAEFNERYKKNNFLKSKEITLFRGIGLGKFGLHFTEPTFDNLIKKLYNIKNRNSWTSNVDVAKDYAKQYQYGYVLKLNCSSNRINVPFSYWIAGRWRNQGSKFAKDYANDEWNLTKLLELEDIEIYAIDDKSQELFNKLTNQYCDLIK